MTVNEYNQLVRDCSDALYRFALKNIKVAEDAQEIVQISFERLWLNKDQVDGGKSRAYLFKIAYHAMVDIIRKQKKEVDMEQVDLQQVETSSHSDYKGIKQHLNRALEQLSDIQRSVILLRDYEGYSYSEIGEITGLNESQVKVNIFRGRQTLQKILGKLEDYL